jgi:ribose/xylose/arabinose/galactoside ABC-type transport system permease subunit
MGEKAAERSRLQEFVYDHRNLLIIWGLLIVIVVVATILQPRFATAENITNVMVQSTALGVISVGQTFVILTAGIDISVGAVASLVVVIMSLIADKNAPALPIAIVAGLAAGALAGLVNGWGVTRLRVSPFMMTLGVMSIALGIALQLRPQPGGLIPKEFAWLAAGQVAGLPIPLFYFLGIAAIAYWVLTYTRFGRYVYAVGGNEETTRLTGLATDRIKLSVYLISASCAALAGIFLSSRIRSGDALIGTSFGLDSITAVVLGGTSLFGGRGSIIGTIAGVFIIASLSNIMNLVGVSTYYQYILKGGLLIVAVAFYSIQRRRR